MSDRNRGYRQVNSVAHQARTTNIGAPSLVRHLAYWIPEAYRQSSRKNDARKLFRQQLDGFLLTMLTVFDATSQRESRITFKLENIKPSVGDRVVLFDKVVLQSEAQAGRCVTALQPSPIEAELLASDHRTVRIRFAQGAISYKVRVQTTTEYFAISIFSEYSRVNEIHDDVTNEFSALRRLLAETDSRDEKARASAVVEKTDIGVFLFSTYWTNFLRVLREKARGFKFQEHDIFDEIFADFRGVVLSDETLEELRHHNPKFDAPPDWGKAEANALLGFVVTEGNYECTASYMLDGRALYMTALGPHELDSSTIERVPVQYVLCVQQKIGSGRSETEKVVNRWQLGRLLDRIHHLGTVRLAALREAEILRNCGARIRRIDSTIKLTRQSLSEYYVDPSEVDKSTLEKIKRLHEEFDDISKYNDFDDAETVRNIDLSYRVERSRHYVAQFKTGIALLRLRRLEGFQQYDKFIERRLGSTYDFIDSLGRRYERVAAAVAAVDQSYLAISADKTENQLMKIGSSIENLQGKIADIQQYGDLFLIGVLVPYYIIATIDHILEGKNYLAQAFSIVISSWLIAWAVFRLPRLTDGGTEPGVGVEAPAAEGGRPSAGMVLGARPAATIWSRAIVLFPASGSRSQALIAWRSKRLARLAARCKFRDVTLTPVGLFFVVASIWLLIFVVSVQSIFHHQENNISNSVGVIH